MTFFSKLGMIYRYLRTCGKPSPTGQTLTVQKTRNMVNNCGFKIEEAKLIGNKYQNVIDSFHGHYGDAMAEGLYKVKELAGN